MSPPTSSAMAHLGKHWPGAQAQMEQADLVSAASSPRLDLQIASSVRTLKEDLQQRWSSNFISVTVMKDSPQKQPRGGKDLFQLTIPEHVRAGTQRPIQHRF